MSARQEERTGTGVWDAPGKRRRAAHGPGGSAGLSALAEAAQTVAVVGAALLLGALGVWLTPEGSEAHYPGGPMGRSESFVESEGVRLWLVDGFNVLHVGLLRGRDRSEWWKRERREELLERAERFRTSHREADVLVVFDGAHPPETPHEGDVSVVFTPSADEWLVSVVREAEHAESIGGVTAARRRADRVRRRGAAVVPPGSFIAACSSRGWGRRPQPTAVSRRHPSKAISGHPPSGARRGGGGVPRGRRAGCRPRGLPCAISSPGSSCRCAG
jgi:predicted RNA-binding protein with PIN domain